MKKLFYLLLSVAFLSCSRIATLPIEVAPDTYQKTFKNAQKESVKEVRELKKEWDIVLDPIEQIPSSEPTKERSILDVSNWGERLLLPEDLKERLRKECTNKVYVKIFDTGASLDHNALALGQDKGRNYTTSLNPLDKQGHSTHVTGILSAVELGIIFPLIEAGVVRFQPVKILGDQGQGSFAWILNAYQTEFKEDEKLREQGYAVVYNGSFGAATSKITAVEDALKKSYEAGTFLVFAAGNSGGSVAYPGSSDYALTTASLDNNMEVSSFSSRGKEIDFAKPGRAIQSTYLNNQYATLSGTSMASPFLAGIVAIAKSKWGDLLPNQATMKAYLSKIATDLDKDGFDHRTGDGIVFIRAILDTKPSELKEEPIDPKPEPERPTRSEDRPLRLVFKDVGSIIWSTQDRRINNERLHIKEIAFTFNTKANVDIANDFLAGKLETYFRNRGMVLLNSHDLQDAAYYAIRFLYMLRFQENDLFKDIQIEYALFESKEDKVHLERYDLYDKILKVTVKEFDFAGDKLTESNLKLTPIEQGVKTFTTKR